MRSLPRSSRTWLPVASLVALFVLAGAAIVSVPPSVVATRIAVVTGTAPPITATVAATPAATSALTVTLPATAVATAKPTATTAPTTIPTPTFSPTQAPVVFDARRLKIGQPRPVTTDDNHGVDGPRAPVAVLNYPVVSPWSPDSRYVLFRKVRIFSNGQWVNTSDLYVAPVNGAPYMLVNNAYEGTWSPDGRRIIYGLARDRVPSEDTYMVDLNGQNARRVMAAMPLGHRPVYLADGTIALVRGGHVVIVDQQGAPIREMPNVSVVSDDNGGFLPSPDGSHLAFKTSSRDIRLKVANARSGEVVALPDGVDNLTANVGWSPDGNLLAYVDSFSHGLVVVGADGQNPRRLVSGENLPVSLRGQLGRPSWSPDGKVIYIGLRSGNTPDDTSVVAVNVDGSGSAQVLTGFMPVAISPDGLELFAIKIGGGNLWLAEVTP